MVARIRRPDRRGRLPEGHEAQRGRRRLASSCRCSGRYARRWLPRVGRGRFALVPTRRSRLRTPRAARCGSRAPAPRSTASPVPGSSAASSIGTLSFCSSLRRKCRRLRIVLARHRSTSRMSTGVSRGSVAHFDVMVEEFWSRPPEGRCFASPRSCAARTSAQPELAPEAPGLLAVSRALPHVPPMT